MLITAKTRWIHALSCGLVIGALDILFACLFWASRGVPSVRIFQSVAAGWYGKLAFTGGVKTASIGLVSHFAIAMAMALLYFSWNRRLCSRVIPWWLSGAVYGAILFFVMQLVVVPLSRAGAPDLSDDAWVLSNLGMHIFIGMICAKWSAWIESKLDLRRPLLTRVAGLHS